MGGISIGSLLIVAVIVVLLFGTKKLRNMGGDLGSAVKGFKKALSDEDEQTKGLADKAESQQTVNNKAKEKDTTQD